VGRRVRRTDITVRSRVDLAVGCWRHFEWAVGCGGRQVVGEVSLPSCGFASRVVLSRVALGQALGAVVAPPGPPTSLHFPAVPCAPLKSHDTAHAHHDRHRVHKACRRPHRRAQESVLPRFPSQLAATTNVLTGVYRGHPRGDERCQTAPAIPRLVRTSPHPAEPLSARGVLPAVEVRGTILASAVEVGDMGPERTNREHRTRDTRTRSASTTSSRSA
jgi:hypothetical protein